ncbi:beta-ketoacyl-ACP synthase III [Actinoplanes sp. N902-109]|uniref:beta-ketoacyl-ACP synthase III n=1 Tax=Actinoplanes sp. (strain N902-109) TaxID=649831 RepID=UPI00032942F8|nr:beta-ketoacyl-ACP synthase III [Actinoplanes sp. N902-109]AGL15833.1 putative 3-oxoacyl-[acyl-carrier-protein] [Actinoplanes sp. N902-109]
MSPRHPVLAGVGAYLPPRVVTNDDLAVGLDTSDAWIRGRTGIAERRFAGAGTSTADLAVEAGTLALKSSSESEADAVVLATATPDHPLPGTAPEVAARLGLAGAAAYDVSAVCAGFLYGLASAAGLIAAGYARRVLLIGAETFTSIIDPADRGTAVIFADGAGAVVLRAGDAGEPGAIGHTDLGSDGTHKDLIVVPGGGSRQRTSGEPAGPRDHYFQMAGRDVYRHAVERMSGSARTALEHAGWAVADVDRFVPHQANAKISAAVADRLGLHPGRVLSNIARTGNTSAASVPLLLAHAAADRRLRPGHRVLLAAFGGGLAWGASTLVWPDVTALTEG